MEILFWSCAFLVSYSYLLYPLLLLVLPARQNAAAISPPPLRCMSVIIAARNEANKIADKIRNTLRLQHEGFELEVLVASDASDDATDDIVRSFAHEGVVLSRAEQRRGKEYAQRIAIAASCGDIIVFTDAATQLAADALMKLAARYTDPRVGAVSSVDKILLDDGGIEGEGLYVRYEMWLRELEGRFNTLVGLSGSFFSARRVACMRWDMEVCSDFGVALNCASLGLKAVSAREVVGYYRNLKDPNREYQRKLRTILRGMTGLVHRYEVLNPWRFGVFSFQVASHKLMRWAVPWLLLLCELSSIMLARDGSLLHLLMVFGISGLCLSPIFVRWFPRLRRISLLRLAAFFVEANAAIGHATIKLLRGQRIETWDPSKR